MSKPNVKSFLNRTCFLEVAPDLVKWHWSQLVSIAISALLAHFQHPEHDSQNVRLAWHPTHVL